MKTRELSQDTLLKIKILHLVGAAAKSGQYSDKAVDSLVKYINKSLPTPPTRTVTDAEIEKCAKGYYAGINKLRKLREIAWAKGAKWMRDKANTPKG